MTLDTLLDSQVYETQVGLTAVKVCSACEQWRPVAEFGQYGESRCQGCRAPLTNDDLEGWWANRKARAAVA